MIQTLAHMRHARHGSKQHVRIFTLKNLQKRFCIFNEIHWMNQLLQPPLSLSCVYKNHNVNVCLSINLVYFGFFWPIWFISTYAKNTPHKWNECCAISFSVDCGCGIPMNPPPPCVVMRSAHYAMYTFYIYSHSWFKQQRTFILIACALPKHCCSCSCLTSIIFNKKKRSKHRLHRHFNIDHPLQIYGNDCNFDQYVFIINCFDSFMAMPCMQI